MKRHLTITTLLILAVFAAIPALAQQTVFPMERPMADSHVVWQRDIYREVNLTDERNIGLCSSAQEKEQQGLFTTLFRLAVAKQISVYRYNIDGNESLNEENEVDIRDILVNHHIAFDEKDSIITVDDSDIPASEVKTLYIKEKVFFDTSNGSFRQEVTAICPVLIEDDDFSFEGTTRYPLFWVNYQDIKPVCENVIVTPDDRNTARCMTLADFFALNLYHGKIYKVGNALGQTLLQEAESDSAFIKRQQQVEEELLQIRKVTYNTKLQR